VDALAPGQTAFARLLLRDPLLILPGDRFIIRMFSPVETIGGGVAIDITGRRYRRGEDAAARLVAFEKQPVELLVRESRYGLSVDDLVARTGLLAAEVERADLVAFEKWRVDKDWLRAALTRIAGAVRTFHQKNPLVPGMPKQELRSRELPGAPPFLLDAMLAWNTTLVSDGDVVRLASHKIALREDEERAAAQIESAFRAAGLAAPSLAATLAQSGIDAARARPVLQLLLKQGRLVRVNDDLVVHREALEALRALLAEHKGRHLSVPAFKDLAGVSRKYAIPLLEYLDRERLTRRDGDERVVL
jgi:selenocysteine-specific elongation factor